MNARLQQAQILTVLGACETLSAELGQLYDLTDERPLSDGMQALGQHIALFAEQLRLFAIARGLAGNVET